MRSLCVEGDLLGRVDHLQGERGGAEGVDRPALRLEFCAQLCQQGRDVQHAPGAGPQRRGDRHAERVADRRVPG
jgi:hypothetical protein